MITARVIFDRRKVASLTHDGSVEIEVNCNGKRRWLPTGVRIRVDQWHNKRGVYICGRVDSVELNKRIGDVLVSIQKTINDNGDALTLEDVKGRNEAKRQTFLEFIRTQIESRNDLRYRVKHQHMSMLNMMLKFGGIVEFSDITRVNLIALDNYLHSLYTNQSTIHSYHKRLKTYIRRAIEMEYITVNPYDTYHVSQGSEGRIKYLTEEELDKVVRADIPSDYIRRARDLFVFQAYTGLAYSDMAKFDFGNAEKRESGWFFRDSRLKTNEEYYLMLLPKAMEVLARYDYKLPIISNVNYNEYLKEVGRLAGIDKALTSHMGRHTFATMVLNKGIPVEVAAKMLGHSQIKTTQRYAKVLAKSVEDAFLQLTK